MADRLIKLKMAEVILTIGMPGSGKSTWAESYCRAGGAIRINADKMRYLISGNESDQNCNGKVFENLKLMYRYLLDGGYSIVVDNLNCKIKDRKFWIEEAKIYKCKIKCVIFNTGIEVCWVRNCYRARTVPKHVLERFELNFEPPTLEEGFDIISYVN